MNSENISINQVEPSSDHVLREIIDHLDSFEHRIADSERKLERSQEIGKRIEDVLNRQLMDGLISYAEFSNLNRVKELWLSTGVAFATYDIGCRKSKRLILENLLDLLGHQYNLTGQKYLVGSDLLNY